MKRCPWCESSQQDIDYHDREWGVPVFDDRKLFEFLTLETAQAGLSWSTILKRRENYREAYENYDIEKVASFGSVKKEELLNNEGIIRYELKIDASINNAKQFLKIQSEHGSFARYLWSFTEFKPVVNEWKKISEVPAESQLSKTIAADLKKKGFKFVGSVTIYAYLQAVGVINDHLTACFRYEEINNSYEDTFGEKNSRMSNKFKK
ncbi:MAG: DNA-3-methyladenine glycosylase I [Halanaerobiales bacterium]